MAFSTLLWLVVQYLYRSGCEPHDTGQNRTVPVPAPVTWVTRLNGRSYSTTAAAWVGEECDTHCMCCNQYILATPKSIKIQILCYYLTLRGLFIYILFLIFIFLTGNFFSLIWLPLFRRIAKFTRSLLWATRTWKKFLLNIKEWKLMLKLDKNVL